MLSIQEVGQQILSDNPGKFYVFVGPEYGIKCKYIDIIKKHYNNNLKECDHVEEVLNIMKKKQIIPIQPALYVVRYDDQFLSSLSDKTANDIAKCNIIGTIVCIYENSKAVTKLAKYLPDFTVSLDNVNSQFIKKYLSQDFPSLSDAHLSMVVKIANNYGQAKLICDSLSRIPDNILNMFNQSDVNFLSGHEATYTDNHIKLGVAARDFKYLCNVLNTVPSIDSALYAVLSVLVELDKLLDKPHSQSDYQKYAKSWTRQDIYYMFMHTYELIKLSRSSSISNLEDCVVWLFSLLVFSSVPSLEDLK